MEFVLLPSNRGTPPIPIPKTPYVCHQRYDGGPFLSYPNRVGRAEAGAASFDLMNYGRLERVNPTPLRDKESFIQTWLYFGFIFEFLCASSSEDSTSSRSQEIIDRVYKMMLVADDEDFNVELHEEVLQELLELARPRIPTDKEARIKHYEHLLSCIEHAHYIFAALPKDFNHAVKFSAMALYELVTQAVRALLTAAGAPRIFGRCWTVNYLNQEAKDSMMAHGWCPSDIARAEVKFQSLQGMHIVRMMDKSLPKRDHSMCTDTACNFYQIDMGHYKLSHETADCSCGELTIDPQRLEDILRNGDHVPLLSLTGHMHNLKVELVESNVNTPYVAISHVWADGLGNPFANSLHCCKLARLRHLVSSLDDADQSADKPPLIWLDTLCCPAIDGEGKQLAIKKIRLVYERAKHVLVLDAGLMAYESKTQGIHEKVIRIFTSGWVRRLWTLQEGALAPSLYFQFADEAVSLLGLRRGFGQHVNSVRYQVFAIDSMHEFWRIDAFFKRADHNVPGDEPDLIVLDQALQFRSVSVASDEPLCIGTLMSLDLAAILAVEPKEDRMQKVWELLAVKKGGIPALVIFFEERRIDAEGWRWAPRSLLTYEKSLQQGNVRIVRWAEGQMGIPTPLGLKIRFPGFKLSVSKYNDNKPRQPWPGMKRIAEAYMHFRDAATGEWFRISDKKAAYLSLNWTSEEELEKYNKLEQFPLHDLADSDEALVLMRGSIGETGLSFCEALFGLPNRREELAEEAEDVGGIAVKTERHIIVNPLMPGDGYLYTTIGKLAMQLRADELTDKHLELYERLRREVGNSPDALLKEMEDNEQFKASIKALKDKMKALTAKTAGEDERFVASVKTYFGASLLDDIWVLMQNFFHDDFSGERLDDQQLWYVD